MAKKGRKTTAAPVKAGVFNVYEDNKGRSIYYNRLNHSGYVLTDNEKAYSTYSMRFMLGLIVAVFAYMFNLPIWMDVLIGIAAYLIMEYRFRVFLKRLPQIPNYVPAKRQSKISAETDQDMKKIVLKMILFLVFAVLIVINAQMENYTGIILILNYALAGLGLAMFVIELRAIILKGKTN